LSEEEARRRLEEHGENRIETGKEVNPVKIFLRQFKDPLLYVLFLAAGISAVAGETKDLVLILAIVFLNAVLGFVQEYRAEKAIESLKKMVTPRAKVVRDGETREVPATEIVPGDVVVLEEGDVVPADLRLVEVKGLTADESMLTGESVPVVKTVEALPERTPLADRKNMAYMGTLVVRGHGRGIVVATGRNTEMGRIAAEISRSERKKTRLEEELERLGAFLMKTATAVVVFTAIALVAHDPTTKGITNALMTSVSLAVAAIPEGLPAVVTITLALGVRQMAKRKAIVRRLKSVETLGSVDVICTDKTGTITWNRMRVVEVFGDEEKVAEVGYFCHSLDEKGEGDPTEMAIYEWARERVEPHGKKVDEIPFDSNRKRMTVIVERDGRMYAYMKGAPEVVLSLCSLKPDERKKLTEKAEALASRGLRVLAMAWKEYDGVDPEGDMEFAGFVGLLDPPREDAVEALKTAMSAGIRVIMITGDHAKTAEAVARMVGIEGRVVTGAELDAMGDRELD
ncbi:TPA: HAD family hydrolase, partial [Candidatus Micrarchaeota archaeon]|nr:HAD family hydrolase [Candidatus Micrarchaeota archaeon]